MKTIDTRLVSFWVYRREFRTYVSYDEQTSIIRVHRRNSYIEFKVEPTPFGSRKLTNTTSGSGPDLWNKRAIEAFFASFYHVSSALG